MAERVARPDVDRLLDRLRVYGMAAVSQVDVRDLIAYATRLEAELAGAREAEDFDRTLGEQVVALGLELAAALLVVEAARAWYREDDETDDGYKTRIALWNVIDAYEAGEARR